MGKIKEHQKEMNQDRSLKQTVSYRPKLFKQHKGILQKNLDAMMENFNAHAFVVCTPESESVHYDSFILWNSGTVIVCHLFIHADQFYFSRLLQNSVFIQRRNE
jgi:hypothetical protein